MHDVSISDLLRGYGLREDSAQAVRSAMEHAGLTRPGKSRIAAHKAGLVGGLIQERFVRVCHRKECQAKASEAATKQTLAVDAPNCEVCGGSVGTLAGEQVQAAMNRTGKKRLLVIGGTPNTQSELARQVGSAGEVRFVSSGEAHSGRIATENKRWADVIVIWASTPIGHKVTSHYKGNQTITVAQRSAAAVAAAVAAHIG